MSPAVLVSIVASTAAAAAAAAASFEVVGSAGNWVRYGRYRGSTEFTASNIAAWTIAISRSISGGVLPRLAIGTMTATAFSSQSVMTLAAADNGTPRASAAPMMMAEVE